MKGEYYSVKNFEKYQHYKDRNPPWIKLYNSLLGDYAFCALKDASKMHLIAIWLLASRNSNRVPADAAWIGKQISATEKVDLNCLVSGGFLEHYNADSVLLAECKQNAMPEKRERRAEKETEGADVGFAEFWDAWPGGGRKVNKGNCLAHWRAKKLAERREQIAAAVGAWKASRDWTKDDGQYIPMPLTWLRQERWENPPAPAHGTSTDPDMFAPFRRHMTPDQLRDALKEDE